MYYPTTFLDSLQYNEMGTKFLRCYGRTIGFSDPVDLWVIKMKKAHDPLRI